MTIARRLVSRVRHGLRVIAKRYKARNFAPMDADGINFQVEFGKKQSELRNYTYLFIAACIVRIFDPLPEDGNAAIYIFVISVRFRSWGETGRSRSRIAAFAPPAQVLETEAVIQ
jgi:hypothetical protein